MRHVGSFGWCLAEDHRIAGQRLRGPSGSGRTRLTLPTDPIAVQNGMTEKMVGRKNEKEEII